MQQTFSIIIGIFQAQVRFGETDADSDETLSWKEYMQETYGMSEEELQEQAKTDKDKKNMLNVSNTQQKY